MSKIFQERTQPTQENKNKINQNSKQSVKQTMHKPFKLAINRMKKTNKQNNET